MKWANKIHVYVFKFPLLEDKDSPNESKKTKSVSYFVSYLFHRYQLRSSWPFKIKIKLARAFHPVSLGKHSALLWYFYKFLGTHTRAGSFCSPLDMISSTTQHGCFPLFMPHHCYPSPSLDSPTNLSQSRAVRSIPLARVREMVLNHRNSKNLKLGLIFIFLNSCSLMTVFHGCFLIQFPLFRNYWKKFKNDWKVQQLAKSYLNCESAIWWETGEMLFSNNI